MALVHALLLSMLITALAAGASVLAQLELRIADHQRAAREAAYAARGAAAIAIHELRDMPDWTLALSGGVLAAFTSPVPAGDEAVCCGASSLTALLRAGTGRAWTAFGWSPAVRLLGTSDAQLYIVVWLTDDPDEGDGDASRDSNSRIALRIEARRADGLKVAAEAIVERIGAAGSSASAAASVRVRHWRELFERR